MERMGPPSAVRLEPQRSGDRQPQEQRHQRKPNVVVGTDKGLGKLDQDRAEVAAAEPENHQLDERA